MPPKRKATKIAAAAEIEMEQPATISQDATEQIIETKKPNKKTTSKKNAKLEIEVANDDDVVDISPEKAKQRPKREIAKKVPNYFEQSPKDVIEPKKSRGKKAPVELVESHENSENDKHVANNSTQADENTIKRTKKSAVKDDSAAVDKGIVEEKPNKAKSTKSKKEKNEQSVEVQAPKRKPRSKAEQSKETESVPEDRKQMADKPDEVEVDTKKSKKITKKTTIDASPEKKSVKSRKTVKKEEKTDVEVKDSPAKKRKIQKARINSGGKPVLKKLARRQRRVLSNEESEKTSNDENIDSSPNFSSDEEQPEPPKEEPAIKPSKRAVEVAKANVIAVKKEEKMDVEVKNSPAKKIKIETARINAGGKTRKFRKVTSDEEIGSTSNDDNIETSKKNSSDEEHEPPKEEPAIKSNKRAADVAKPNDTAVTKRNKNEKSTATDKAKPKQKMNSTTNDYTKINFESDKEYTVKICSWNVAGLRALVAKNGFDYFEHEKPDIICLQEIKCLEDEVPDEAKIPGYHMYWCSKPGGRGGVALLTKKMPYNIANDIGDEEMDKEGRIITAEYSKFYLICVYVPNAGRKLVNLERRLRWNKMFEQHVNKLKAIKPVVIVGDMNVAHNEIDLANPKTNTKNAGFSIEERNGMTDLLSHGFIDTYRHLYPERKNAYTFWSYMGSARAKNVGWRLDYGIVSENLASKLVDNVIRSEILGSDHCPMLLLLNL